MTKLLSDALVKPQADDRAYRVVELKNGLRVCLVSDPQIAVPPETAPVGTGGCFGSCWGSADKEVLVEPAESAKTEEDASSNRMAACALCVGVGYLQDPATLGGCAHFVEHMCFMGTKDYPDENGWSKHVARYGGLSNAETEAETTVYYFDIHPGRLRETLRRFGSFFATPLFKWGGSKREVKAIHSEFEQAAQNDAVRVWQILSSLVQPGHPYDRFGWGNRRSLVEEPRRTAVDVRAELLRFHSTYYSSSLMTAVIIGREPLDILQAWAHEAFAAVPNRAIERPRATSHTLPVAPSELPIVLHIEPIEQTRAMTLYWYLPPQLSDAHLTSRPTDLVGHLLGHEGAGSILAILKTRGWATELAAGVFGEGDSTAAAALFSVSIELTREGVAATDAIVCIVCGYLGRLAVGPPPERYYVEMADVARLGFAFAVRAATLELRCPRRLHPCSGRLSCTATFVARSPTDVH